MDERIGGVLTATGFTQSGPWLWTRPNTVQQAWVSDDQVRILPYDGGRKHLANMHIYANVEDVPALLTGRLTDEEREAVEFGRNALMDLGFNRPAEVLRWLLIRTRGDA